jgi:nucleoside 2-deoxyribosyltransferase
MNTTQREFLLYLAGPITGLTWNNSQSWREGVTKALPQEIRTISPLRGQRHSLSGVIKAEAYVGDPTVTDRGINGRDRFDVFRCDAILINFLGATQVSKGTMIEIGWADALRKPIIVVMEDSGNVHDHPMLRDNALYIVNNLDEAVKLVEALLLPEGQGTPREVDPDF